MASNATFEISSDEDSGTPKMSRSKPCLNLDLAGPSSRKNSPYSRKFCSLTPVAEVAPRMPFEDDVFESSDEDHYHTVRTVVEKPKNELALSEPSTSKDHLKVKKLTPAELLVTLSERRRSLSAAVIENIKRKSVSSNTSKRKSPADENVDPLRANVQLFSDCLNLIKRNQGQLLFNIFLIMLVALILTSMIVFAVFAPPTSQFEITLTSWATFWPLDMRLRVYRLGKSHDSLTLKLGLSDPPFTSRTPSYCSCCTGNTPSCQRWDQERCFCFHWRSHGKLYMTALKTIREANTNCLLLEWRSSSRQRVDVTDCFRISISEGVYWYGGTLTGLQNWPLNINITDTPFKQFILNDIESDPNGFYAVGQPVWVSNNGFMLMPSLDHPFLVNKSNSDICLRSNDLTNSPLKYMICTSDDPRTYTINISTFNRYVTESYPAVSEINKSISAEIIGTAFVSVDASTVTVAELEQIQAKMAENKFTFGLVYEYFDLLNDTMASNLIRVINETRADSFVQVVEVSNFLRFYHFEGMNGEKMQEFCVRQSSKNTIGVSKWRDRIFACLDFTRTEVIDWYTKLCADHAINTVIDYLSFTGGDASTLPMFPNLNLSNTQTNFYSTFYARTVTAIPRSLFLEVAYNTHEITDLYLNIPISPLNIRSIIPLLLSISMEGYSRFALNLINYTMPEWPVANTHSLYTWLELAMYSPVFRIPSAVLEWPGFNDIIIRYKPYREQVIMKHYGKSLRKYLTQGQPVFRPIWWTDYLDYSRGKYASDASKIWNNDRQFMIGDDLLVAAFLQVDGVDKPIYLPPGRWRNPETGKPLDGGQIVYIDNDKNVACFERIHDLSTKSATSTMQNSNINA